MPYTTKSGKVLTDADIEKLADEAEDWSTGHGVTLVLQHGPLCAACRAVKAIALISIRSGTESLSDVGDTWTVH